MVQKIVRNIDASANCLESEHCITNKITFCRLFFGILFLREKQMATYVVGDIQGCFKTFQSLLRRLKFKPHYDKLIVLGDFINRGPRSLEIIRYIIEHEEHISVVLGNHEIFALAIMLGVLETKSQHTLHELLTAPDRAKIIDWLQARPLLIRQENNLFVHAGLLPSWSIEQATNWALIIQEKLASTHARSFLSNYFSLKKTDQLSGDSLALASLTRMRMCVSNNMIDLSYTGGLTNAPKDLKPWFMLRDDGEAKIYFGHWAALGFYNYRNYHCLDSGCGWGRSLSALDLEDHVLFQVDNCDF